MVRFIICALVIFSLLACNFSDTNKKFSNGITYIIEGGKLNGVIKQGEKGFFLQPNVETVKENQEYILFVQSINSDFVKQNVRDDLSRLSSDNNKPVDIDSAILSNQKLKKQMKYKRAFWILIKEKDSLIGPFSDLNNLALFEFDEHH